MTAVECMCVATCVSAGVTTCMCECEMCACVYVCVCWWGARGLRALQSKESTGPFRSHFTL